ncbi:hypothetical protein D3C81_2041330 [compost metagenome]
MYVTFFVALLLISDPSLTLKLIVRVDVFGVTAILVYMTERRAFCHWAIVATPPEDVSVITPMLLL